MITRSRWKIWLAGPVIAGCLGGMTPALAQSIDKTEAPNAEGAGIAKSLFDEIGPGRGDDMTPGSSRYILRRDPFRSIRRGRQPGDWRGARRLLRRLPRPPERLRRTRRGRRDPAGQSGRSAPVRCGS